VSCSGFGFALTYGSKTFYLDELGEFVK